MTSVCGTGVIMNKWLIVISIMCPLVLFVAIYVFFAYNPSKSLSYVEPETESQSVTEFSLPMLVDDGSGGDSDFSLGINGQLHMLLPVAHVSQLPELPTGCEITSLTTVLNYLGFDVDKTYMNENYLDKLDGFDGSFYDYFIGDPTTTGSYGCFAPAITSSANRFLMDRHSQLLAYNISGSSVRALLTEVYNGNPVIIWTSSKPDIPTTYTEIRLGDNTVFNWPSNEHCAVLIGFNLEKNTVFISDPLSDIIEEDLTDFIRCYNAYYKQAVVLK